MKENKFSPRISRRPESLDPKNLDDVAYVCVSVADMPIPYIPSLKGVCRRCKQEVYYSKYVYENDKEARKIIDAGKLLCVDCAIEEKQVEVVIPDATKREFFKWRGQK